MTMTRKIWGSGLALALLGVAACGGDSEKTAEEPDSGEERDPDGGLVVPKFRTAFGTLVAVTAQDTSAPITIPHKIVVLDALTDQPLGPAFQTMTSAVDGSWEIKDIPTDKTTSLHIMGEGDATTGDYDSVLTNITGNTADDALTRISAAGTASLAGQVGGFTAKQDMSALTVGVYHVRDRKRIGVIGCVQAWLDDDPNQPPAAGDLRYVNSGGLPTPIAMQDKTEATRGAMLFANIATGTHKMKFSVDGGKTFFGQTEFRLGKSRNDATSAFKGILYQIGVEVDENITPPGCQ
jgi:hypothetical protein